MIWTAQSLVGGIVYGLVFLGLAGFVWMQHGRSDKLLDLRIVAGGFALLGAFFLLDVPFDLARGFLSYGTLQDVVMTIERFLGAVGQLLGIALIVVGATRTAVALAGPSADAD